MSFDQVDRFRQEVGSEIIVADRAAVDCVPLSDGESLRRTCIALRAERNFFQVQHARALEREEALKAVVAERDATDRRPCCLTKEQMHHPRACCTVQ